MKLLILFMLLTLLTSCSQNIQQGAEGYQEQNAVNELPTPVPTTIPSNSPAVPELTQQPTVEPQQQPIIESPAAEPAAESPTPKTQEPKSNIIASFSTKLLDKSSNRITNIKTAAKAVNGKVIKSGEIFSFNKIVGERTEAKGYKTAPVLIGTEHTDGIGGGVCQVSTTIFQAAEKGGFEIIERHKHKKEVAYAKNGTDATVNYNDLDLKFKNTLGSDIKLIVKVTKDTLTVKIEQL